MPAAAVEEYSGGEIALMETGPLEPTWYGSALLPDRNTVFPVAEMQVKSVFVFWLISRSPIRPPQPIFAPSPMGACACHTDCWSLCEKRLGGSFTERAWYCARVVGTTSGPTLARTASLPASHCVLNAASEGWNANSCPPCDATAPVALAVSAASRGIAIVGREALYRS